MGKKGKKRPQPLGTTTSPYSHAKPREIWLGLRKTQGGQVTFEQEKENGRFFSSAIGRATKFWKRSDPPIILRGGWDGFPSMHEEGFN